MSIGVDIADTIAALEAPAAIHSVDLADGPPEAIVLPRSRGGEPYRSAALIVRQGSLPLGWIRLPVPPDGTLAADAIARAIAIQLGELPDAPASTLDDGEGADVLMSVIVPTCADAAAVIRCVKAITEIPGGPIEVIVVENRPGPGSRVAAALDAEFGSGAPIKFVEQPSQGLSHARNAGVAAATGSLLAFIDDDVVVDHVWARELRQTHSRHPAADCITGSILPLELETPSQALFEQFASFNKGFAQRTFSLAAPPDDVPLFPYTAGHFGTGANFAFKADSLRSLGEFDTALGTGTLAMGGEDLDIFIRVIRAGGTIHYDPTVLAWHKHPDNELALRRRAFAYGVGLTAALTKLAVSRQERRELVRLVPAGVALLTARDSRKNATRASGFPIELGALELIGTLYGPVAYARAASAARRERRRSSYSRGSGAALPPSATPRGRRSGSSGSS